MNVKRRLMKKLSRTLQRPKAWLTDAIVWLDAHSVGPDDGVDL